jgi:hypothetical protein
MSAAAVTRQFATTRAQLETACDLLRSPDPEVIDRCSLLLESASRQMADCRSQMGEAQGDPAAIEEAWRVRRSFVRVAKLLEGAARFHTNWVALRGTLTGGYTQQGEPAPVRHAGRICVEA